MDREEHHPLLRQAFLPARPRGPGGEGASRLPRPDPRGPDPGAHMGGGEALWRGGCGREFDIATLGAEAECQQC